MPTRTRLGRSLAAIAVSSATFFLASCNEEPTLTVAPPRTESNDIVLAAADVVPNPPANSTALGDATIALTPDEGVRRLVVAGEFTMVDRFPVQPDGLPSTRPGTVTPPRIVNIFKAESSPFDESTGPFFASVELIELEETPDPNEPTSTIVTGTFEDTIVLQDQDTVDDMFGGQFYLSISTEDSDGEDLREELRAQMLFE